MPYSRITLLPSQQVIFVEEGETILDAALRAGLNLPHSCKGGHCSSCRARIRDGSIVYPRGRPLGLLAEEEREGYALLCQAHATGADLTIEVREIRPPRPEVQVKSLPCRIERMHRLAPEVMAVFLRLPANEEFHFVAGQYLDIMLPQNRRRSFSIASCPGRDELIELHIRKVASGEFTQQLFDGMKEKTLLRDRRPAGPVLVPARVAAAGAADRRRHRLCAAALDAARPAGSRRSSSAASVLGCADAAGPVRRRAGARTQRRASESALHAGSLRAATVRRLDRPPRPRARGGARRSSTQLQDFDVYASGPPAMVEAVRHEFIERGLPAQQLFFDSFDYAPDALAKLNR